MGCGLPDFSRTVQASHYAHDPYFPVHTTAYESPAVAPGGWFPFQLVPPDDEYTWIFTQINFGAFTGTWLQWVISCPHIPFSYGFGHMGYLEFHGIGHEDFWFNNSNPLTIQIQHNNAGAILIYVIGFMGGLKLGP